MRFSLLDRITELEPGHRITAIKTLTLGEEYLMDHFPRFPVMPGVLMLEAMTQAGAWLVRASDDFAHSIVVLKEAANVKYGQFVEPGQTLVVSAEIGGQDSHFTRLKTQGRIDGQLVVSAKLVLERYSAQDRRPGWEVNDETVVREARDLFALLYRPQRMAEGPHAPVGHVEGNGR